jgi:outer membrane lipoprotein SlyB
MEDFEEPSSSEDLVRRGTTAVGTGAAAGAAVGVVVGAIAGALAGAFVWSATAISKEALRRFREHQIEDDEYEDDES